ncbi:AraC family transcriptional regulator [Zooshikella sp. RANM57]|uniref:AraC family transcriptional regulator n=1 Tax=Zooshikella sp. RANM57 TaxID=3425863 RepID=UPI003D701443
MPQKVTIEANTLLGEVSWGSLLPYLHYANQLGINTQQLLKQLEITSCTDTVERLPGESAQRLLLTLIDHANDTLFGLHAAQFIQPASYNVLGYITMNCATLKDAIQRITPYEKLVGDMGRTSLHYLAERLRISWSCIYTNTTIKRHMVEHCFAAWTHYARWITGKYERTPIVVNFSHNCPLDNSYQEYEQLFNCPVLFEQPENSLDISLTDLQTPLQQASPALLKTLEQHAQHVVATLTPHNNRLAERVKAIIRQQLSCDGALTKEVVAKQLAMTTRTLHRHLQHEQTTFQQLLDYVRMEQAKSFLKDNTMTIHTIAENLGFTEVRSFQRSFKRWTGLTPSHYRLEQTTKHSDY